MPDLKPLSDVDLFAAVGHWHPLFLHLPLGLLAALALLELRALWTGRKELGKGRDLGRSTLVVLLAIAGPLSAATGWFLHESEPYVGIDWHEYTGIATGFLCLGIAWTYAKRPAAYRPLVFVAALLVSITGHLGANITHGTNYVLQPWLAEASLPGGAPLGEQADHTPGQDPLDDRTSGVEAGDSTAPGEIVDADLAGLEDAAALASYAELAAPVLDRYCTRCHGERRQRDDLRLDSYAAVMAGSEHGAVVVPGEAKASRLIEVLYLPESFDAHMPPSDKPQPTEEQVAALVAWVDGLAN